MKYPKIWLLGASFDTSNMGLSALAESSFKCIFTHWPQAEVILLSPENGVPLNLSFHNQEFKIKKRNLWFGRNVFRPQNGYKLLGYALILKFIPLSSLKNWFKARNPYFKDIMEIDLVVDITGGDSFSDLYGIRRLIFGTLLKWIFIVSGKKLIMLPQTYGPFNSSLSKVIARSLLARATAIYSRDQEGVKYVKQLLGKTAHDKPIQFIPDVAFVLDPDKDFNHPLMTQLGSVKANGRILVGFNISGILYNNRYPAKSSFGLNSDYRELVEKIIQTLLENPAVVIILVPHVYAKTGNFESDPDACRHLHQKLVNRYPDRLFLVEDTLDHKQVKCLIGHCDFFLGSRMHSCIAGISQSVPTIGVAYSGKFIGVFESVGVGDYIVDLRTEEDQQILARIQDLFNNRHEATEKLRVMVPKVQEKILGLFDQIDPFIEP